MVQDDESARARAEAIDLIMKQEVGDVVQLAEELLQNQWFTELERFVGSIRKHHEAARYAPQGSYARAEAEQEILTQLGRIRKNKAFL